MPSRQWRVETPHFDKPLILLGNFHVELAFFGAVGTFLNGSGIEAVLPESGVLAEGSIDGFIKGKFYNRCQRIHEMTAIVLEQLLFERFSNLLSVEEKDLLTEIVFNAPAYSSTSADELQAYLGENEEIIALCEKYNEFFESALNGQFGMTAQFWTIYIYLINRIYRNLQRCVRTNDVSGYIGVLSAVLDIFFALNRSNYARYGVLFLHQIQNASIEFRNILEGGAFSIGRTIKNYSRCAVDLSLEQSYNRDAASAAKGIVTFRNSESAMRRWALARSQTPMAVSDLRSKSDLEHNENASAQTHDYRIRKDNEHMQLIASAIEDFGDPFSSDFELQRLMNIASGKSALSTISDYLLQTLKRGKEARKRFTEEWKKIRVDF